MPKRFSLFLLICLVAVFGAIQQASARIQVTWVLNDLTPFYIKDGPYQGQGISDKLTLFFQARLPEYEHKQEFMNYTRFFKLAERGNLVCNPLLLKTPEREKILAYSRAFKPAYAHILVSSHKMDGPVSLAHFLKTDGHRLIVQKKRSYGPVLDKIIAQGREDGRIQDQVYPTKQLFKMLENDRIEHFVDIENSVVYYRALFPGKDDQDLVHLSITEDRLDRFGYAVCTKSVIGQDLIKKINAIIEREKASPEFRAIVESWMAKENLARFRSFYEREIIAK